MRVFKKLALGLLLIVAASMNGAASIMAQSRMYDSSDLFYDELEPYGRWLNNREFGLVWIPDAEPDFQPYATNGHWVITEYGNTWVSDYEWGWAPFHYGRWNFDNRYGWMWIPGTEWGPAWVSWRHDNDNYGWAPLVPGADIRIDIYIPLSRWIFVPKRYITNRYVSRYCLPRTQITHVYNHTTVINNIYVTNNRRYVSGPRRDDIERETRSRVIVQRIDNSNRASHSYESNRSLRIYRQDSDNKPAGIYGDSNRFRANRYNLNGENSARDNYRRNGYENSRSHPNVFDENQRENNFYRRSPKSGEDKRYTRQRGGNNTNVAPDNSQAEQQINPLQPESPRRNYDKPKRDGAIAPSQSGQQNEGNRSSDEHLPARENSNQGPNGRSRPVRG